MRLNLESFSEDQNQELSEISEEELDQQMAQSNAEIQETLVDVQEAMDVFEELEDISENIQSLKTTVETFGVSNAVLHMANHNGDVCELLEVDELPEVTEENQQDLAEKLISSLEASDEGAVEKIKKFFKKILETILGLIDKAKDFIKSANKKLEKEGQRLDDIDDPDPEALKKEVSIHSVQIMQPQEEGDPKESKSFKPEELYKAMEACGTAATNAADAIDEDIKKIDLNEMTFPKTGDTDDVAAGKIVENAGKPADLTNQALSLVEALKNLDAVGDKLKKGMKALGDEDLKDEDLKAYKTRGKTASDAVKNIVSAVNTLVKDTLQVAKNVKAKEGGEE